MLDEALEAAGSLPPKAQDDIARFVLRLVDPSDHVPAPLMAEEAEAIARSKAAAARGDFASEEQVRAVWRKHGL